MERQDLREVLSRLLRWRVGANWYAVALLPAPLLAAAVRLTKEIIAVAVSAVNGCDY
jgi:alkylhydroperoxidase family enzyme